VSASINRDTAEAIILPVVERNLAAGVRCLPLINRVLFDTSDPLNGTIWRETMTQWGTWVLTDDFLRLDKNLVLSGSEHMTINYEVAINSWWSVMNTNYVLGTVQAAPSRLYPVYVESGIQPLLTEYDGFYKGDFIELYPTTPRTWMNGGWDRNASWTTPYEVLIDFRASSTEDKFMVEAESWMDEAQAYIEMSTGDTWDEEIWNDDNWSQGNFPFWPNWFDASNNFTASETDVPNHWIMTTSRATKAIFNIGVRSYSNRHSPAVLAGINWVLKNVDAAGVAVVTTVNDHTFTVNTTAPGTVIITALGTNALGLTVEATLTITVNA
jgi:hypothetical protein